MSDGAPARVLPFAQKPKPTPPTPPTPPRPGGLRIRVSIDRPTEPER